MKITLTLFVLAILSARSFSEVTIRFVINDRNEVTVSVDGKVLTTDRIPVPVAGQAERLAFSVSAPAGAQYTLTIASGKNSLITSLNQDQFKNNGVVSSDKLSGLAALLKQLTPAAPVVFRTVMVLRGGKPIHKTFSVTMAPGSLPAQPAVPGPGETMMTQRRLYLPTDPFYDAFALLDTIHLSREEWTNILRFYLGKDALQFGDVPGLIRDNPFLSVLLRDAYPAFRRKAAQGERGIQSGVFGTAGGLFSTLAGLDVTNVADGLAKFLVKRSKQELSVTFFTKFKETISDPNFRDLQTLFPATYIALTVIGDQIYNYDAYIQTLRESFEKDLRSLPDNVPGLEDLHPEMPVQARAILSSACFVARSLRDREHPGDVLNDYPLQYLDNMKDWKGTIQTLQLISASLRDSSHADTASYWVSPSEVRRLLGDSAVFRVYLGLLYEQAGNFRGDTIRFERTTLRDIMRFAGDSLARYSSAYRHYLTQFADKAKEISRMIRDYQSTTVDSLALEQYYNYFNASLDLLELSSNIGKLVPGTTIQPDDQFWMDTHKALADYFDVARSVSNLVWDIKRRSYASAVVNVVHVYKIVVGKPVDVNIALLKTEAKSSNVPSMEKQDLARIDDLTAKAKEVMPELLKYGTFMATIVQAKNSDDVEAAIEAFTLPAGSSRIKRESRFNVSLNAYVGLYGGYEAIKGFDKPFGLKNMKGNSSGVAAPIGITASTGFGGWSVSLFGSILDIGAIASFRAHDDSTKQIPIVQLKNIVSPGLFASVGFPSCPISMNLGIQLGPNLHTVKSLQNDYSDAVYWRFSLAVCVDIPLVNFYTAPKD